MQFTFPTVLDGEWIGTIHMDGHDYHVGARFGARRQRITGSIDLPWRQAKRSELTRVTVVGDRVHFVWKRNGEKMIFDASLDGEQMRGDARTGHDLCPFELLHLTTIDSHTRERYSGAYGIAPGQFLILWQPRPSRAEWQAWNIDTGYLVDLYPTSETRFVSKPSFKDTSPPLAVVFHPPEGGRAARMTWIQAGTEPVSAERIDLGVENVQLSHGEVTLDATLITPAEGEGYPAVVIVGDFAQRGFLYATYLACRGIAALGYAGRGFDAADATFADLADDALAAADFLRHRETIVPEHVGLWGLDSGRWIAPLAAARSSDLAFLVVFGPALSTPAETHLRSIERAVHIMSTDPEMATSAEKRQQRADLWAQFYDFIRAGKRTDVLDQAIKRARQTGDWKAGLPPRSKELDTRNDRLFLLEPDYDPLEALAAVRAPVLAFVLTEEEQHKAQAALSHADTPGSSVQLLAWSGDVSPNATGGDIFLLMFRRIWKTMLQATTEWIRQQTA